MALFITYLYGSIPIFLFLFVLWRLTGPYRNTLTIWIMKHCSWSYYKSRKIFNEIVGRYEELRKTMSEEQASCALMLFLEEDKRFNTKVEQKEKFLKSMMPADADPILWHVNRGGNWAECFCCFVGYWHFLHKVNVMFSLNGGICVRYITHAYHEEFWQMSFYYELGEKKYPGRDSNGSVRVPEEPVLVDAL